VPVLLRERAAARAVSVINSIIIFSYHSSLLLSLPSSALPMPMFLPGSLLPSTRSRTRM
jgi:hypothetical protein